MNGTVVASVVAPASIVTATRLRTAIRTSGLSRINETRFDAMLKNIVVPLICLASLVANVLARPGFLHGHPHYEYPIIAHPEPHLHVAKIIHIPAAVSHQSSTVIHSAPHHIIKPIVVPVVKTVVHPVYKTYHHPAPTIFKAYHPEPLHYDPFHHGFHHYH